MSKFEVIVVLPPTPPERYPEALAEAMEPYSALEGKYDAEDPNGVPWVEELRATGALPREAVLTWAQVADAYNSAHGYERLDDRKLYLDGNGRGFWQREWNPNGQWDAYLLYRTEGAHFPYRPEAAGDPRLWDTDHPEGYGRPDRLAALPHRCDGGPRGLLDLDALREAAARFAAEDHDAWTAGGWQPSHWPFRFTTDRADNIARARASAVPGFALLRLDGSWTDANDWRPNPMDAPDRFWSYTNDYLDALDPDAVVLSVSCHC
ncbi:hypothetical protein ACFY00_13165 [Kitasatospora sp. NPDC001540]|uniref:hypothetical protein n=1 Tax=Kitasatospora sp. NPDC001540 TaxID=3364014 RepID=UPI00367E0A5A